MSTRHPRRSQPADATQMAREVDSLINTMGVDPMAIEVNGEQQPDIREAETTPVDPPAPAAGQDDAAWKTTIDPEVHAAELALVEAHAKAKLAVELERVKAEAAAQRQAELANQEAAAIVERERAVAEARAQAEAAARDSMASELARARTEAEQQLARELERSREQMERQLSERLGQSRVDADRDREVNLARSRAEAEATRAAAVQEARQAAEAAATRALEAELGRVRAETESKLQAELASLREQADAARRQAAQAQQQAEAAREQAARDVQAAAQRAAAKAFEIEAAKIRVEAESRLKEESERSRTEASQRLEEEVAKLRSEHQERPRRQPAADAPATEPFPAPPVETPAPRSVFSERFSTAETTESADEAPAWKVWTAAAAAAAAVVIIGTGGYLWWDGAATPAKAPETAPPIAVTEPEKPALPAPRTRRNGRGDAAREAKPAGTPAVEPGKVASGLLTVYSRVPLDLVIDGVRVGSTDDGQIVVPAGRRRIELVNKRLNYRGEVNLDVASGQVTTHTATLPPGQLRIAGAAGGEVWVEGEHVGTLPLGDISVPLGTREVLVRHPLFGERRQTVEVTYGAPTQVSMLQQESGAGSPQDAASKLAPLSAAPAPRSDAIR